MRSKRDFSTDFHKKEQKNGEGHEKGQFCNSLLPVSADHWECSKRNSGYLSDIGTVHLLDHSGK